MKREGPMKLAVLEAVWNLLPVGDGYEETCREMIRRRQAGFTGEERGDSEWQLLDIPDPYYLLHDVHITVGEVTYQLDTIFICPKFALIVEMKNIAGEVNFDEDKHQFTRKKEGEPAIGLSNPADQVNRHRRKLRKIFNRIGIQLPITGAIVFAYSSTVIGNTVTGVNTIHLSGLQRLLDNLYDQYNKDVLPPGQARQLVEYLQAIHAPQTVEPTSLIPESVFKRLRNGVMCTNCDRVQMRYQWKSWTCQRCGMRDKSGHIRALKDYRLLYGETITNKQFREYCGIESISAASRLLREMNLPYTGSYRNRSYRIK